MAEKLYSQNSEESNEMTTYSAVVKSQPFNSSFPVKDFYNSITKSNVQQQYFFHNNDLNRTSLNSNDDSNSSYTTEQNSIENFLQTSGQSINNSTTLPINYQQHQQQSVSYGNCFNNRNRYMPYHNYRLYSQLELSSYQQLQQIALQSQQQQQQQPQQQHPQHQLLQLQSQQQQKQQQFVPFHTNCLSVTKDNNNNNNNNHNHNHEFYGAINGNEILTNGGNGGVGGGGGSSIKNIALLSAPSSHNQIIGDHNQTSSITLQISNLDYTMDEISLRNFLLSQLKPITPVQSIIFESSSCAKVTVPDINYAKQVVSNLHRKKIGHRRMVVSYTRDSSLTEFNTLRCQVAGLLKDVPYCTLPIYKFRELFLSRFKTSISVLDLHKMNDICTITTDKNEEKYIQLHPDLMNSIENSPLMECLQHSVPYCMIHFKREQHKGWAEQDIEPLPNVFMTISEIQQIVYPLLKRHPGDIPISSLVHCIEGELGIKIQPNDNGINLEHLICCAHGIQITTNNFGIKILSWLEPENAVGKEINENRPFPRSGSLTDPLYQLSREVIELIKMCPKSTLKFDRFIPAYHNLFGKQCRVADYGYTKLIEVLEALSSVVQVMGDGENRQITLTHRTQIRRFTSDLLRIIRAQSTKSILLSQLPHIFSVCQNRNFDITEYGVCDIVDILDGLVNSNIVVLTTVQNDILISIPKRKQTSFEIEKTSIFAGECVELLRNIPQYSIQFRKFVRSYHYHFGYQCRLSDYGFLKLADLMEAIHGVVEIEYTNDEDKKVFLSPVFARRVFAEQLEELILEFTGSGKTCMKLEGVLELHKKKFGYKIQPQTLGVDNILDVINMLPYVEIMENDETLWIICHVNDQIFRTKSYNACRIIQESGSNLLQINDFKNAFNMKYNEQISDHEIISMKHAIEIHYDKDVQYVGITKLIKFLLRIIGLLDKQSLTLSKIKTILNIDMTDCFEFGYPNLFLMLKAFPDIFVVNAGLNQEKSEIGLVSKLILSSFSNNIENNHFRYRSNSDTNKRYNRKRSAQILKDHNNYSTTTNHQSFISYNRPSKILHYEEPIKYDNMNNNRSISQEYISEVINKYDIHHNLQSNYNQNFDTMSMLMKMEAMKNQNQQQQQHQSQLQTQQYNNNNNKENFFKNDLSKNSLNSSCGSDPNSSYGSVLNESTGNEPSKLYLRRRNEKYMNDVSYDLMNVVIPSNPFKPSKPDTPATPIADSKPFWMDPIWKHNDKNSPQKLDSLKIELPELKPYILPVLLSPYSTIKFENMMNEFTVNK